MRWEKIKPRDKAKESGSAISEKGKTTRKNKQSKSGGGTYEFLFSMLRLR